jgi:hypothetical protein
MSSQQTPPAMPDMSQPQYIPPREPNVSARTLFAVLAVAFVVLAGGVLVAVALSGSNGGSKSPEGALKGYISGVNSGSAKAAFDHTVMKFMPNYDSQIAAFDSMIRYGDPHIHLNSVSVVDNSSMTQDQMQEAQDIVNELLQYLNIEVQDMAFVEYNMTIEYTSIGGGPQTFSGHMLCVEIEGHWYLAMTSYFD